MNCHICRLPDSLAIPSDRLTDDGDRCCDNATISQEAKTRRWLSRARKADAGILPSVAVTGCNITADITATVILMIKIWVFVLRKVM